MKPLRYLKSVVLFACVFGCAAVLQAQSGRRAKAPSTPTPTAPAVSEPKTVDKKPTPKLQLLVGIADVDAFAQIPFYVTDTVLDSCVRRLAQASEVMVTSARRMNRAGAVKQAKAAPGLYVVFLEVDSNYASSGRQQQTTTEDLFIRYTIFEPETAKVKQSGLVRQSTYRQLGVPRTSRGYSDYSLKKAAYEAADRILEAFQIKLRPDDPHP
jgi:hypothetical protein